MTQKQKLMTQFQALNAIKSLYPNVLTSAEYHIRSDGTRNCWLWVYKEPMAGCGFGKTWSEAVENLAGKEITSCVSQEDAPLSSSAANAQTP